MLTNKLKTLLLAAIALTLTAQAKEPKFKREKDGFLRKGFDKYVVCKDYSVSADGTQTLVGVTVTCRGEGDVSCPTKGEVMKPLAINNGEDIKGTLTDPEIALMERLVDKAEDQISHNILNGNLTETIAIQMPDQTVQYFLYEAEWTTDANGVNTLTIYKDKVQ